MDTLWWNQQEESPWPTNILVDLTEEERGYLLDITYIRLSRGFGDSGLV